MNAHRNAIVVGAGVIGLATAARLLDAGWRVRVVAAELPERTTSAVAAAILYPYGAGPRDKILGWAARTYATYLGQAREAPGIRLCRGWELFRSAQPDPDWAPTVGGVTRPGRERLPTGYTDAYEFTTPIIGMPVYLSWLSQRVLDADGTIEQRRVASLAELGAEARLVVNCAGLGARVLAGDESVKPVRGQVVRVTNPGITRFVRDDAHPEGRTYIYPRGRDCILGGTAEHGRWDVEPDPEVADRILRVCRQLEPALAGAEVIEHRVGLRPWRPEVRLEVESGHGRSGIVVHNYGHGGAGVTLAWGCAEAVAELARQTR